jgi:predicted alpha/beta-hydrolase family hydrolase
VTRVSAPAHELRFSAGPRGGDVSAILMRPTGARSLLVLGHGAGAGMRHAFMESIARRLADESVATLRYQFPYAEAGGRRPDPPPVLIATVRSAIAQAGAMAGDLPLFAGGKSMGGRMTSLLAADAIAPAPMPHGLVFLGFPLHAAGRPSTSRGAHLERVRVPMLFLQGTRDRLADLELMGALGAKLGEMARMHVIDGADHGFHMLRRSGRSDDDVLRELAATIASWIDEHARR